ncbi:hypothetical protein, partial [Methylobacterium sp. Gmos1]
MTSLSRAPNGDWFARKGIPKDVREAYKQAHGVSQEERFRHPKSLSVGTAKAELRDWDATVTGRIEALRAAARGEGRGLTHREAHGLAGEWYAWFVAKHEQDPWPSEEWDHRYDALAEARSRFRTEVEEPDENAADTVESPATRRHVRQVVTELGQVASFLGQQGIRLTEEATAKFLDLVDAELGHAMATLRRGSEGDYTPDTRVDRHPEFRRVTPEKRAGLTPWSLFEAWVKERKPGNATINRWRAVMRGLEAFFEGRDIAAITEPLRVFRRLFVLGSGGQGLVADVGMIARFGLGGRDVADRR